MGAIGGDIKEISFSNASAGSGTVYCKSAEGSTFDLGGFRNEITTDGSGQGIRKMNNVPWKMEVTASWDMNTREDLERLDAIANSLDDTTWDITHSNGAIYSGVGTITGDLAGDGNEATISLTVMGGGKLSKQG
tara:strand:- start:198 stop:599 length:402 start_codon:yes stop_codon:yes gene_type:complete